MEHELSLLLGPVQNQIFPFYARFSASIPQAYQENAFDIAVDTFRSERVFYQNHPCPSKLKRRPNMSATKKVVVGHGIAYIAPHIC